MGVFEFSRKKCNVIEKSLKYVRYFDVLRSDKTTASAGLEIRVPYFDKDFMDYYMGIKPENKVVRDRIEKYLLRKAFDDKENPYLLYI